MEKSKRRRRNLKTKIRMQIKRKKEKMLKKCCKKENQIIRKIKKTKNIN